MTLTVRAPVLTAVERCVGDLAAFAETQFEKTPFVRRGGDCFDDLLSLGDFEHLVDAAGPRPGGFRVIKAGETLPSHFYTSPRRYPLVELPLVVDPARIGDLYSAGATLVLLYLENYWPRVAAFCRELGDALSMQVQANAYLTPPGEQGLDLHHDSHDVFVLQIHGRKRWRVFDAHIPAPVRRFAEHRQAIEAMDHGDPLVACDLEAGDVLYVPAGFLHEAAALDQPSLHITLGLNRRTWIDLLKDLIDDLADDVEFRKSLPLGFTDSSVPLSSAVRAKLGVVERWLSGVDPDRIAAIERQRYLDRRLPLTSELLSRASGPTDEA